MFKRIFGIALLVCSVWSQASPLDPAPVGIDATVSEAWLKQVQQVGRDTGSVAGRLVTTAMGMVGIPYYRGGESAQTGFDCSGLVRAVYQQTLGLALPRRAVEQAQATEKIAKNELQPGDLVFFNTMRRAFSHVGIYIGGGKFVHAPRTGETVRVEDMNLAYWARRFNGASRPVGSDAVSPD
ncbi:C40 family peptidase [Macromonas nakdongensis]|uniref:C40 family peptidase n=1 Tax=Macromonas nakdongensis TaxID=1843082 RepID=UPI000C325176|nr:C40 family peptidase [Macromonas nakdongensis]